VYQAKQTCDVYQTRTCIVPNTNIVY